MIWRVLTRGQAVALVGLLVVFGCALLSCCWTWGG